MKTWLWGLLLRWDLAVRPCIGDCDDESWHTHDLTWLAHRVLS